MRRRPRRTGLVQATNARTFRLGSVAFLALGSVVAFSNIHEADAGGPGVGRDRIAADALRAPYLVAVRAADPTGDDARFAIDGRDDTVWTGRAGEAQWRWTSLFARPVHVGLLRAHFGNSSTSGVPTAFRWEAWSPKTASATCDIPPGDESWTTLAETAQSPSTDGDSLAQPTRRSWFVDAEACGLRLVVDRTNAGPPVVREVEAMESARDVLRSARASDDGEYPGFLAEAAIDGTYSRRWAGAPGKSRWTLRIDLPTPQTIDRVRLVLGFDSTTVPRPGSGRSYAVAWAPIRYVLEVSEDGRRFVPIANEPMRADGTTVPLRRRMVTLAEPRAVRALRLVMSGATGESGLPEIGAVPVVREIAAYRADDKQPVLAPPWILSVNANPSGQTHLTPGGEVTNDAYHARFLQSRLTPLLPALAGDDRYARSLGPRGEPLDGPRRDAAGEVLEAIEGDDPELDGQLLAQSSPPPLTVLSGSNDWDYALETAPDRAKPKFWHWDPLRDARFGGMGHLARAVRSRMAPFLGFCGGAQILALLETRRNEAQSAGDDLRTIDQVLRRTSGRPIRGFAPPVDVERAWPTDPHPLRAKIQFAPNDSLFADLAGPLRRSTTQALPELHSDVIRPDAFLPGGPLERFEVVATSAFCAPGVVAAGPRDASFPDPSGLGWCDTVVEAFRSREHAWPIIGAQFHAEQWDFATAAPGDPPESIADARLFLAAAYETMIDAYVKLTP
jgi:hypothetical protein